MCGWGELRPEKGKPHKFLKEKFNLYSGYINWQTFSLPPPEGYLSLRDLIKYSYNLFFQLAPAVALVKLSGFSCKRKMFLSTMIVGVDGSSGA